MEITISRARETFSLFDRSDARKAAPYPWTRCLGAQNGANPCLHSNRVLRHASSGTIRYQWSPAQGLGSKNSIPSFFAPSISSASSFVTVNITGAGNSHNRWVNIRYVLTTHTHKSGVLFIGEIFWAWMHARWLSRVFLMKQTRLSKERTWDYHTHTALFVSTRPCTYVVQIVNLIFTLGVLICMWCR